MSQKDKLDLNIAMMRERAIAELQKGLQECYSALSIVDANMKNSHMALLGDLGNMSLRMNFFLKVLREKFPNENWEENFKAFAKDEKEKIEAQVAKAMAMAELKGNKSGQA
jgi:hypothetical protein